LTDGHRNLLDTNVISALAKDPQGALFRALSDRPPDTA